jgi:hypothetical protein
MPARVMPQSSVANDETGLPHSLPALVYRNCSDGARAVAAAFAAAAAPDCSRSMPPSPCCFSCLNRYSLKVLHPDGASEAFMGSNAEAIEIKMAFKVQ